MPYGYLGTAPNQIKKNSGVFSVDDINELEAKNHFGGSMKLITEINASTASSIVLDTIFEGAYDVHLLHLNSILYSANAETPVMRFSNDGGSSYEVGTAYNYGFQKMAAHDFFGEGRHAGTTGIFEIMGKGGSTAVRKNHSYIYLYNLGDSSKYSYCTSHNIGSDDAGNSITHWGGGMYTGIETVNAIQILCTSGATITGNIKLYGLKQ